jgi:hypothetical protein
MTPTDPSTILRKEVVNRKDVIYNMKEKPGKSKKDEVKCKGSPIQIHSPITPLGSNQNSTIN